METLKRYKGVIGGVVIFWVAVMAGAYLLGSNRFGFGKRNDLGDNPTVVNRYIGGIIEVEGQNGKDISRFEDELSFSLSKSGSSKEPFRISVCDKAIDNCIWFRKEDDSKRTYEYRFVNDEDDQAIMAGGKYYLLLNGRHHSGGEMDKGYSQIVKLVVVPPSGVLTESFRLVVNER